MQSRCRNLIASYSQPKCTFFILEGIMYKNKEREKEYYKKYYQEHKKLKKEQASKNYQKNKEFRNEQIKRYHQEHKEQTIKHMKEYYQENKEHILKCNKKYRQENRKNYIKSQRKYRRSEKGKAMRQRENTVRQSRIKNILNTLTAKEWLNILKQYDYRCAYCGKDLLNLFDRPTRDHIMPVSKGGDNIKENIVPACQSCNSRKHNKII